MIPPTWRWKVTYSTSQDRDRGRFKEYDGALCIWSDWISLQNAKGAGITGRNLADHELITFGSEVFFPAHHVIVGMCTISPFGDHSLVWNHYTPASKDDSIVSYGDLY